MHGVLFRMVLGNRNVQVVVRVQEYVKLSAAIESILAEAKLEQLRKATERKLKRQLLNLDNEIADAEDQAELARIKTYLYDD